MPSVTLDGYAVFGNLEPDGTAAESEGIEAAAELAFAQGLALMCPDSLVQAAERVGHGRVVGVSGLRAALELLWKDQWAGGPCVRREETDVHTAKNFADEGRPLPCQPKFVPFSSLNSPNKKWTSRVVKLFGVPIAGEGNQAPAEFNFVVSKGPLGFSEPQAAVIRGAKLKPSGPGTVADISLSNSQRRARHQTQMRTKILTRSAATLSDSEVLEMLLYLAFRKNGTEELAAAVIEQFGSFAKVLSASEEELLSMSGFGGHAVSMIKIVREAAVRLAKADVVKRPLLNNWDKLIDYLQIDLAREPVEHLRVLYLDTRNRLLRDELMARGTVNHTPVYPREIIKCALRCEATALILAHNHPSGDPRPSRDDIEMTREVRLAVQPLNIILHDHVIIGNGRWISFRREGIL